MKKNVMLFALCILFILVFPASQLFAVKYPYDGKVSSNVRRDRIIAIAEDYLTLYYYVGADNIKDSSVPEGCAGSTCPDKKLGWKNGMKYCWGGADTTRQYLLRLTEGDVAGNKWCSSPAGTSYDSCSAGTDCSGYVSNTWTSGRYATSNFMNVANYIEWDNLRMGDAILIPGHIRLFDCYISGIDTMMVYESTSSGGTWRVIHRSLSRSAGNFDGYTPIRYNKSTYKVYDYPEPTIQSIIKSGVERLIIKWDGQADRGFRLYLSVDGAVWRLLRDFDEITSSTRSCEVSGLQPDTTYFFKMRALNASNSESIDSAVAAWRDDGFEPRVLLVDGADRFRQQFGANHTFLTRVGNALGSCGAGFDYCANEFVVNEQTALGDYESVVWILAEESTFDETFSWAEQLHVMDYLKNGGRLFVSGSEIGWDLDYRADWASHKNGSPNDRTFYNEYLRAGYVADDAEVYHVQGKAGSIFEGLEFSFDDGTHGTYNVATPDTLAPMNGAIVGLTYDGGANACVYHSSPSFGTVVNMGFPFETIYPQTKSNSVMNAVVNYFDLPAEAPTFKAARRSGADSITVEWQGYASAGYRLFQKINNGSWTQIRDESQLKSGDNAAIISGLNPVSQYAFKIQAIGGGGASADSDVYVCALPLHDYGDRILIVDGYDRWNSQYGLGNHTLLERYAEALANYRFDSCANEYVVEGAVTLGNYDIVIWMCGQESTESETFSKEEQTIIEDYLKSGGKLFVSGSEIGWDLSEKADTLNTFSNGDPNDSVFFENYLKAGYLNDNAGSRFVRGVAGTVFNGLSFNFDDGNHGSYNVKYPDLIEPKNGSAAALYYGTTGTNVAGVLFSGMVDGGTKASKIIYFGFPFETIYEKQQRRDVMMAVLSFFVAETAPVKTSVFILR